MAVCTKWMFVLAALVGCGDNRLGPDAPPDVGEPEPSLPFFEMPFLDGYNQASETIIAAAGDTVVALAIHQAFPSADSFEFPETDDDLDHPFRRLGYVRSTDGGETFSSTTPLTLPGRSDPVIAAATDGSFWAAGIDPQPKGQTDLFHSVDGAVFTKVITVPIGDKEWIAIDEVRQAVWIAGFDSFSRVGFDGTLQAQASSPAISGFSSAYSDASGVHVMNIDAYQAFAWNGTDPPAAEGEVLFAGEAPELFTQVSLSMGLFAGGTWIVRPLRNSATDAPVMLRVRQLPDEGSDVALTAAGAVAFMPAAVLDADGRLHIAWYETQGPFGQLLYAHSVSTDLLGAYTTPIVVDGNACPGNGFYPYGSQEEPFGGRRLREYIGIATSGNRAFITWTHAPEAPSRVRVAHVDF